MATLTKIMHQVSQLQKHVAEDFNLEEAQIEASELSKESVIWILQTIKEQNQLGPSKQSNPLPVALALTQVLSSENIQLESKLLYEIAKACRLFTECFFSKARQNKNCIYQETKIKFIQNLDKVLGVIPDHQITTRYELQCARAAARSVPVDQYFFEKYIPGAIDAGSDLTGGSAIKLAANVVIDTTKWVYYFGKEKIWFEKVLQLSWTSHALLQKEEGRTVEQFYSKVKGYEKIHQIALCAVETLIVLFNQQKDKLAPFIKGDSSKPGLLIFVDLQSEKSSNLESFIKEASKKLKEFHEKLNRTSKKDLASQGLLSTKAFRRVDPFWKVRYRAIEHLYSLFQDFDGEDKKEILKKFSDRILLERDPLVIQLLRQLHKELSQDATWQSLVKETLSKVEANKKSTEQSSKEKKQRLTISSQGASESQSTQPRRGLLQAAGDDSNDETSSPIKTLSDQEKEQLNLEIQLLDVTLEIEQNKLIDFFS
jgi:hypothetical protein